MAASRPPPIARGEAAFGGAVYAAAAFWAADSCGGSAWVVVFPCAADRVAADVVGHDLIICSDLGRYYSC